MTTTTTPARRFTPTVLPEDDSGRPATGGPLPAGPRHRARQEAALLALVAGASVTEAAKASGACRQTVSGWLHHDPAFRVALQSAQAETRARIGRKTELAALEALDAVRALLGDADPRVRLEAGRLLLGAALKVPATWPRSAEAEALRLEHAHHDDERAWLERGALLVGRLFDEDDPEGHGGLPLRRAALPLP